MCVRVQRCKGGFSNGGAQSVKTTYNPEKGDLRTVKGFTELQSAMVASLTLVYDQ